MVKYLEKKFALSRQGAKGMRNSAIIEFLFNMVNMVPFILLMAYIDKILMSGNYTEKTIVLSSIITLVLMLIIYLLDYDAIYNNVYRESFNTRVSLAERLKQLPLSYFSRHDLSDISQTVMSDVEAVEHAMGHAISKTAGLFLFLPVISVMLIAGNVKLGLSIVIPMMISLLLIILSKKIQIKNHGMYYHVLRENSEAFQENIELNKEIRAYGLKEEEREKIFKMIDEGEKIHLKTEIPVVAVIVLSSFVLYISLAIVIITSLNMYVNEEISILYVVGYVVAASKIKDALDAGGNFLAEIFYLDARIKRIREIKEAKIQEGKDVSISNYEVEFDNVGFSYEEEIKVLKGTSFIAEEGKITALVGKSGCGKTSILRLVSRLY